MSVVRHPILACVIVTFCFALVPNAQAAVALDSTAASLAWAICWGGQGHENAMASAVDSDGNTFVAGTTTSSDLPVPNGFDTTQNGSTDDFVAKFTPDGQLAWATYLGGTRPDSWIRVAVDGQGNVVVAGETRSTDFPTLNAFQSALDGGQDAYVAKFTADGDLLWSTFLGGDGWDYARGLAIDGSGTIIISGASGSTNFPGRDEPISTHGAYDGLVAKLSSDGDLVWSALIGGSDYEMLEFVWVDRSGFILASGYTRSSDFTPVHGFQKTFGGGSDPDFQVDGLVVRLNPAGHVMWSSYFGGSGNEFVMDSRLDPAGNLYIAGVSDSPDLPGVDPAVSTYGGGVGVDNAGDAFAAKITRQGRLIWTTYLGGAGNEQINSIALLPNGNLLVAGETDSQEWPEPRTYASELDAFAATIARDGAPMWVRLFEGAGNDSATRALADDVGNVYLAGTTEGKGFPICEGPPSTYGGGTNLFVMKVSSSGDVIWSSITGGTGDEYCGPVVRDGRGSLIVVGRTLSEDFPWTASFLGGSGGGSDVVVMKVDDPDSLPIAYGTTASPRPNGAPTFTFKMQPGIVKPRICFSTSPDFSAEVKARFVPLKRTATSWKPGNGRWKALQRFAGEGTLYWRIEGKNWEGRIVYSQTLEAIPAP